MRDMEERLGELDNRKRFDPFAAAVSDGKRQELEAVVNRVQAMRTEAAVKAWARVATLLAEASQGAAREYAASRKALEEAKSRVANNNKK